MVGGYQLIDLTKFEMPNLGHDSIHKDKAICDKIRNDKPTIVRYKVGSLIYETFCEIRTTGAFDGLIKVFRNLDISEYPVYLSTDDDKFTVSWQVPD